MNHEHPTGDCPEEVESVEEEETGQEIDKLIGFPQTLQSPPIPEQYALLPEPVKRRVRALKRLQLEATHIEAQFYREVNNLECKYHKLYVPLYEKRDKIVNAQHEPTDEEAQWQSDDEMGLSEAIKEKVKLEESKVNVNKEKKESDVKGIPDFWLTIFRNVSMLSEMVQPHDVPILKHLTDIKTVCKESPMSFTLEFHFSTNEFFTNAVLTKEYEMKCVPEEDDPFSFEGPEIFKCTGCTINWHKGKNATLKTIKKKQKHKSRGVIRTVTKTVQNDSFFNFFNPPTIPEDAKEEEVDEDLRNLLTADFEIGHYIRERIVPRAVLYFTGEELDDEDFDEEEDEEDDDDDEDSDKEVDNKDPNCKQQ